MKKYIIYACAAVLGLVSCEPDEQGPIYDAQGPTADALINFGSRAVDFPVPINTMNFDAELEVPVEISSVANVDRTFNISVNSDLSTADPANYRMPSSVTIPAGSYNGSFIVEGTDNSVELETETIVVQLEGLTPNLGYDGDLTINLFEVCPIPDTFFVGDYQLTGIDASRFGLPYFNDGVVTVSANGTVRSFSNRLLGAGSAATVELALTCGDIIMRDVDTGRFCNDAIFYGPASQPQQYDLTFSDDSIFFITFNFDVTQDCGGSSPNENQLFQMVKI